LVDAVFYFLAWLVTALEARDFDGKVVEIDSAAWGELMYVFSAAFGLAAAGCGFLVEFVFLANAQLLSLQKGPFNHWSSSWPAWICSGCNHGLHVDAFHLQHVVLGRCASVLVRGVDLNVLFLKTIP
jgi:hypothetical protein